MSHPRRYNYSKQFSCQPTAFLTPSNEHQLADQLNHIKLKDQSVRVIGSGLSPGDIAMSDDALISTEQWNQIKSIDRSKKTVTVEPGVTIQALNHALSANGLAMPVLGSITQQTIAGAVATATHGTGLGFGSLSSLVASARLMTVDGDIVSVNKEDNAEDLKGIACHLGCLGVISELTLNVVDAFDLSVVEQRNTLDGVLDDLDERLQKDYFRFLYIPHTDHVWEWQATACDASSSQPLLSKSARLKRWYNEKFIDYHVFEALHYISSYKPSLIPMINQWRLNRCYKTTKASRADSASQFSFECLFRQNVNEWCIPIEKTGEALKQLRELIEKKGYKVHLPVEVRFVKSDDAWLSPNHGRDSCYINVIAYMPYGKEVEYKAYFNDYEKIMASLGGRPHWAKYFTHDSKDLSARYPCWQDFLQLRNKLDPHHRLSNAFSHRIFDC